MTERDELVTIGAWMRARGEVPLPPDLMERARRQAMGRTAAQGPGMRVRTLVGLAAAVALLAVGATAILPRTQPSPPAASTDASFGPLLAVVDSGGSRWLVASDAADGAPLADRARIDLGQRYDALRSPDGRTLALIAWRGADGSTGSLSLLDLETWAQIPTDMSLIRSIAAPTWSPDGTALLWFQALRSAGEYSIPRDYQLMRWTIGDTAPVPGPVLAATYVPEQSRMTDDGILFVYGQPVAESYLAADVPQILRIDVTAGTVTATLPLDDVVAGQSRAMGSGAYREDQPAVVWDLPRDRLLVAEHERLTTIQLGAEPTASTRSIAPRTSLLDVVAGWLVTPAAAKSPLEGETQVGALSPDGSRLYLTGTRIERVDGTIVRRPMGIRVVDAADGEILAELGTPLDQLVLSPDGTRLVAGGTSETYPADGEGVSSSEPTDLVVLDAADLSELARVPSPDDVGRRSLAGISPDSRDAYVLTTTTNVSWPPTVELLDLATGTLSTSRFPPSTFELLALHG